MRKIKIFCVATVILLLCAGALTCGYYVTQDPFDISKYSGVWIEDVNDLKPSAQDVAKEIRGHDGYICYTPNSSGWFVIYGNNVPAVDKDSLKFHMVYESKENPETHISGDEWAKLSQEQKDANWKPLT